MNKLHRAPFFVGAFLLLSLLTLFSGCTTHQTGATPGSHLENYHKVYFVWSDYDPRKVAPRVVSRLKQTGFEVADVNTNKFSIGGTGTEFELSRRGRWSIHHINAVNEKTEPSLVCFLSYISVTDDWEKLWGFQHIQIEFFDSQNGDLVYFAKKYQYEPVASENAELNRLFVKISDDFSPGQPNPFKRQK